MSFASRILLVAIVVVACAHATYPGHRWSHGSRPHGVRAYKCGSRRFYDKRTQICCSKRIHSKRGGDACCGRDAYRSNEKTCCDGKTWPKDGGTDCCGNVAYVAADDGQVCCDGKLGPGDGCCGAGPYFAETHTCCGGSVADVQHCCGNSVYDPEIQVCCEGVVGSGTSCCSASTYDPATHMCCGDSVAELDGRNDCCEDTVYDTVSHACCDGNLVSGTACCGPSGYLPELEVCCSGQVAFGDSCCGDVAYDTTTHICCHDNLQERLTDGVTACCDNRVIDTTANLCCDGQVHEATPGLECCGADAYDPANQECVDDELVKVCTGESCEIGADIADEEYFSPYPYCGFTHYDPDAGEVCCQGVITSGALCCGTRGYSPKLLMCCDGVLHERIGLDTVVYGEERDLQCCGNAIP